MFSLSSYGTKTEPEVLKVVENLNVKGSTLLKNINSYGYSNLKRNFFIFQKVSKAGKPKQEFLRLCLKSEGFHSDRVFYWSLEYSFKPFNYKHNHRQGAKWESEKFKGTAEDLYLIRFYEAIKKIEDYIKSDRDKSLKELEGGIKK